eukprot:6434230-Pyramimonas_sp.AAC.1
MEGVGLIEKKNKNQIQWKTTGSCGGDEEGSADQQMTERLQRLQEEERQMDKQIAQMKENLRLLADDRENQERLYVTESDLKSLQCFTNDTIISIRAPAGTSLEVPDPNSDAGPGQRYRVILRSSAGPIACYLVNNQQQHEQALAPADMMQPPDPKLAAHLQQDEFAHVADGLRQSVVNPLQTQPSAATGGLVDEHMMDNPLLQSPTWLEPEEEDYAWFGDAKGEPEISECFTYDTTDYARVKSFTELPNMFFSDVY